uniref:Uncharacterized protein n=1 Tax=Rhizophora mucronata TaxID=61149 RepID=A0A2P2PGL8_RHIMU
MYVTPLQLHLDEKPFINMELPQFFLSLVVKNREKGHFGASFSRHQVNHWKINLVH